MNCACLTLIVYNLFFRLNGKFAPLVPLVTQLRFKTCLMDGSLNAFAVNLCGAPAAETTFSSIIIEPKSLAPACKHICATCLPTVSQEACIFLIFGSIIRLNAIMRIYSSPVILLVMPRTFRSNVPSS